MKSWITTLLVILFAITSNAQIEKVIHQTFEIKDEVNSVSLDLYDEFEIEKWAGNNIMTVAKVELVSGAQHILDFFVEQGRYEMEMEENENSATLASIQKERQEMNWKNGLVYETVKVKMYVPEDFDLVGTEKLVRKIDSDSTASTTPPIQKEEKKEENQKKDNDQ